MKAMLKLEDVCDTEGGLTWSRDGRNTNTHSNASKSLVGVEEGFSAKLSLWLREASIWWRIPKILLLKQGEEEAVCWFVGVG